MTYLMPHGSTHLRHLRLRAGDTQESEGITWLLHTAWRLPLGGAPVLLHQRHVLVGEQGTHGGGHRHMGRLLQDAKSVATRDALLGGHPGAVCPTCGGWAALVLNTAGNSGPTVFTSVPGKPWRCPVCPQDMPIPALCPPSAHAHVAVEAQWAALAPERFQW
jgi:hypothetical protein